MQLIIRDLIYRSPLLLKLGVSIIYIRMKRMKTGDFEVLYAQTPQNAIRFLTLFSYICQEKH